MNCGETCRPTVIFATFVRKVIAIALFNQRMSPMYAPIYVMRMSFLWTLERGRESEG